MWLVLNREDYAVNPSKERLSTMESHVVVARTNVRAKVMDQNTQVKRRKTQRWLVMDIR